VLNTADKPWFGYLTFTASRSQKMPSGPDFDWSEMGDAVPTVHEHQDSGNGPTALDFLLVASPLGGGAIPPGHTLCIPIVVEEAGTVVAWQFQTQGKYSTFSFGATFVSADEGATGIYYTPLDESIVDDSDRVWRTRAENAGAGAGTEAGGRNADSCKAKHGGGLERVEVISPQARVLCHERVVSE
jgi:hypothetical protein